MFELYRSANVHEALLLRDQLTAAGVLCRLDRVGRELRLIILRHEDETVARAALARLQADPKDKRWRDASWQQGRVLPAHAYGHREFSYWQRLWRGLGLWTASVILACVAVYAMLLAQPAAILAAFSAPDDLHQAWLQPWRWWTPALLHFSLLHLVFNLLWWWQLAQIIERLQSTRRLLLLSLLCAGVSNAVQWLWSGPHFGGLSGVIYGLAAYATFYPRWRPEINLRWPLSLFWALLIWALLASTSWFTALWGATANAAHFSGLICGIVLAAALALRDGRRAP